MSSTESDPKKDAVTPLGERHFLVMLVGDWAKMGLTFILGIITAGLLGWWNAKEPHIKFSVSDPIQFPGEKLKVGIVNVLVSNDGTRYAKDLEVDLRLKGTRIQEVKTTPEILRPNITISGDKCFLTLPRLNHNETLQISSLAYDADKLEGHPDVSVRAEDVKGDNQPIGSTSWWGGFFSGAQAATLICGTFITMFTLIFDRLNSRRHNEKMISIENNQKRWKEIKQAGLGFILRTEVGRKILPTAIEEFSPGQRFSNSDLAKATGLTHDFISKNILQLEYPARDLGIRALEMDGARLWYFEEETHEMLKELVRANPGGDEPIEPTPASS